MGIVYISHRLGEIFECCDAYTVLCDGRHVDSGRVADIDKPRLIKKIIGRELTQSFPPINERLGKTVLEVEGLTSPSAFKDISFNVRAGEVVGLAGLVGAGKTELVHAIFGNHKVVSGRIRVKGEEVRIRNPRQAIRLGIGLVPDERRALGLNMMFDIKDNTTLPSMARFRKFKIFQDHKAEAKAAFDINEKLELTYYSLWQSVKNLSGGNQQKIVIAKWMLRDSEIILLDEPTRGIDVGAKFEIYKLINELTKQGKSVVLVSPELEELIGLCNRVYILFEGSIMDVVEGERKTQEVIINTLLGVKGNE
jgi:ABC-type sugar transport system ATPase subunit